MVKKRKTFIVIAYDIKDDKKRIRLHKKLKNYGTPVQYSVFECILDRKLFKEVKEMVEEIVDLDNDLVRYYQLCEECRRKIQTINGRVAREESTIVV